MFTAKTYQQRRHTLKKQIHSGLILFLGNPDSPMNYRDNVYPFRQDSSFLYYGGISRPKVAILLDLDSGEEYLIGDELDLMETIFLGPQPALIDQAKEVGISKVISWKVAENLLKKSCVGDREIHYLPQYRGDNQILLSQLLDCSISALMPSATLIKAIIEQRLYKSADEIQEISQALEITKAIHLLAMHESQVNRYERDIVAKMVDLAVQHATQFSYPIIFTLHGEVLHELKHNNLLQDGRLLLNDSGVNSQLSYASDITRTFPINGRFSSQQRDIYQLVYHMQKTAFAMLRPGINYRDIHLQVAHYAVEGLIQLGIMRGDSHAAVEQGAYALFFPHGLGHALGLDVHDMENFGEDYVGYTDTIKRSEQFGLSALRFAKPLQEGLVLTVEPGIYFIPLLIEQWRVAGKCKEFINYEALSAYLNFGGVRIEDNIVITADGYDNLSAAIPSEINAVEAACR